MKGNPIHEGVQNLSESEEEEELGEIEFLQF
jgi:hypothetical protein